MKRPVETRRCKHCGQTKLLLDFHVYNAETGARRYECKACHRARMNANYLKHRGKYLERARANYAANPAAVWTPEKRQRANERARVVNAELKKFVIDHYGARCFCCGETEPKFLTIDHVNNDGAEKREIHGVGLSLYKWIVKHNFPADFQILCYNCNCGRYHNGGVCPHHGRFNDYSAS